jgi:membrane-associated phospholipid phosphatase
MKTAFTPPAIYTPGKLVQLRLPPEIFSMLIFATFFLVGYLHTKEICLPSASGRDFVFNHYISPVLAGIAVMALLVGRKSWRTAGIIIVFCLFSVFAHFNFKTWAPVINPTLHDPFLHHFDVIIGVEKLKNLIISRFGIEFLEISQLLYHALFVTCFFLSFVVCTLSGGALEARRLNFSICITLLAGGVLYWVFPAIGSFMYMHTIVDSEMAMARINLYIHQTQQIPAGMFLEGLAAMPSLHLAHATVFFVHVFRNKRLASIPFAIAAVWFAFAALYLGWHYFLDIIPGVLLGLIATMISYRLNFEEAAWMPRKSSDTSLAPAVP